MYSLIPLHHYTIIHEQPRSFFDNDHLYSLNSIHLCSNRFGIVWFIFKLSIKVFFRSIYDRIDIARAGSRSLISQVLKALLLSYSLVNFTCTNAVRDPAEISNEIL